MWRARSCPALPCMPQGGRVVVYGCASGQAPAWRWQHFVFKDIQVRMQCMHACTASMDGGT